MSKIFGLIGKSLKHSFSKKYFEKKFENLNLPFHYLNFELKTIDDLPSLLSKNNELAGFNVTIPYKEAIVPFLDKLSTKAKTIGAVNCVKVLEDGKLMGYNTDAFGFKLSFEKHLKPYHKKALILGTGGASKAVAFALEELKIPYTFVSRRKETNQLTYDLINSTVLDNYQIIINTTPLGTFPNINECPKFPYQFMTKSHYAFDLIYNPSETKFLANSKAQGATIANGESMLIFQAEKSWEIWNEES